MAGIWGLIEVEKLQLFSLGLMGNDLARHSPCEDGIGYSDTER